MPLIVPKGTKLQIESSTPGTYTDIAQLTGTLTLPKPEPETEEARTFDTVGVGIPYESTGWVEGGSCSGELLFHPVTHADLIALTTSTSPKNWKILLSTGAFWTFTGASFTMEITGELAGNSLQASFEIKLSGVWEFTAAA